MNVDSEQIFQANKICHDLLLFLLQPFKKIMNKSICILINEQNDDKIKWSEKRVAEGHWTLPLFLCKICGSRVTNRGYFRRGHCCQQFYQRAGTSTPAAFEPQDAPAVHRLVNAGKVNNSSLGEQRTEL